MDANIFHKSVSGIRDFVSNHARSNTLTEICGFIGYDEESKRYVATIENNIAEDPKSFFLINPANFLKFKNQYEILAVFHSHILADESPSEFDIKMSEACCIPFAIYSLNTKKFHIYEPSNADYNVKLLARLKAKL